MAQDEEWLDEDDEQWLDQALAASAEEDQPEWKKILDADTSWMDDQEFTAHVTSPEYRAAQAQGERWTAEALGEVKAWKDQEEARSAAEAADQTKTAADRHREATAENERQILSKLQALYQEERAQGGPTPATRKEKQEILREAEQSTQSGGDDLVERLNAGEDRATIIAEAHERTRWEREEYARGETEFGEKLAEHRRRQRLRMLPYTEAVTPSGGVVRLYSDGSEEQVGNVHGGR